MVIIIRAKSLYVSYLYVSGNLPVTLSLVCRNGVENSGDDRGAGITTTVSIPSHFYYCIMHMPKKYNAARRARLSLVIEPRH